MAMGAHASSPKGAGMQGRMVRSIPQKQTTAEPFAAADLEREDRVPRRCLPLAWSGDDSADAEDADGERPGPIPGKALSPPAKEAWQLRPVSRTSEASTATTGLGFSYRPGSASSQPSLPSMPSMSSSASLERGSSSSWSRASPAHQESPLADNAKELSRRRKLRKAAQKEYRREQEAVADARLEETVAVAKTRAAASMEALQAKLDASRNSREFSSVPPPGAALMASPSRREVQAPQLPGSTPQREKSATRRTGPPPLPGSTPQRASKRTPSSTPVRQPVTSPPTRQAWSEPSHIEIPIDSGAGLGMGRDSRSNRPHPQAFGHALLDP